MVQQWLTLMLNLTVTVVAVVLVTLATQLRTIPGFTGVGLLSLMSFGEMLSSIIRCWTQLETSIGAVSRLKRFDEIVKSENLLGETEMHSETWPQMGNIEIDGVSASYAYVISYSPLP
jgi:ATP-binding cassette, subfamily C (CFTR/MRP), member 1